MLIRIVRLTFESQWADEFLQVFDETAPQILATNGCHHLELWRDAERHEVFTTYSLWEDPNALDRYRNSDLFRSTWHTVKPNFSAPPVAHSYNRIDDGADR